MPPEIGLSEQHRNSHPGKGQILLGLHMLDVFSPPRSAAAEIPTIVTLSVGPKTSIVGALHFDGVIQLDGQVRGEIRCRSLTISKSGSVDGVIVADTVTVAGEVDGSIYANELVLASTCAVDGLIIHRELSLEPGCYFEGRSRRFPNPLHLVSIEGEQ
jgi:cytoskeletal protein CcmA (bactofilin family)